MNTSNVATRFARAAARIAALTLTAGAFSLLGTVAFAQNSIEGQAQSTVTVQAPRVVHHKMVGTTSSGITVELLSQTRKVNISDLNLSTSQGRAALHERIRNNARKMCEQLGSPDPFPRFWVDDVQTCVQNAMLTWMPYVHGIPHVD